ncbi:MMPL family transporter [Candidatus Igneacidithiobacillus taiwanensis]|uniref:MMPL family transporter n=1 Tax=Candidatus Igneacidithiobacillus taiwanensis TaxID=1945924 RepID=UPI0028963029|nr:MMPL family transporter [Candidatus Igneacidithiobacillus taiwanensis]
MISPAAERFLARLGEIYMRRLCRLMQWSVQRARLVLLLYAVSVVLGGIFIATHFAVNTDTSDVLSRDLPFQQEQRAYNKIFPQDRDSIVVVLQGKDASATQAAVRRVQKWAQAQPHYFRSVYVPGGGTFFQRNGLLYLPVSQVRAFAQRITDAQPLIASLSANPSLAGLSDLLSEAVDQRLSHGTDVQGLTPVYEAFTKSIDGELAGKPEPISWANLMGGSLAQLGPKQGFVILEPVLNYASLQPAEASIQALRKGLHSLGIDAQHGLDVGITGQAVLDAEQLKTVSQGAFSSLALTLGLEILLLILALRSTRLVVGVLLNLVVGILLTTTWALLAIGPFNLISVSFAILFIGLGIDFGIQFSLRFREELFNGTSHEEAMRRVARGLGAALSLAAVAAAISFFAFVPTSYAGIVDLGLISGSSMLIGLLLTITLLPAFLTIWPLSVQARKRLDFPHFRRVPTLTRYPIHRYAWMVLIAVALLAAAAVPAALRVRFDFNPLHMIDQHAEGVKVFESLLANPDTAPYRIDILAPNLQQAELIAKRVRKVPTVARAITLADYLPADQEPKLAILNNLQILVPPFSLLMPATIAPPGPDTAGKLQKLQAKLQELAAREQTPQGAAAGALAAALQRFLEKDGGNAKALASLQATLLGTLPDELQQLGQALLASQVTLDTLPQDLRSRYLAADGQARVEVFPKENLADNVKMLQFVNSVRQVEPHAVGTPVMLVEGGEAVLGAFQEATYVAVAGIALLLLISLRRYRDMLLIVLPLLLAALFTVAAMSLLGVSFNLGNIIVLPLLIGLGVAFGIYIVLRWRSGVDVAHLLQTSTPMAVFFSGLTTLSAFGSMALSVDPGMASLGDALSIALVIVLLCILIVLPALLLLFTSSPKEEGIAQDEGS